MPCAAFLVAGQVDRLKHFLAKLGRLAENGEMFDSAYQRGAPEIFPSDQLIPGWVEALSMMKPGDRWMLYIPSKLAYGERGTPGGPIPPNADLMFEVEMVDVLKKP